MTMSQETKPSAGAKPSADFEVHTPDEAPLDRRTPEDGQSDEQTGNPGRDLSHDEFKGDERAKS